ncbi:MAG: Kelch repeat-containing protein [Candidatus Binataceae bacterium]
MAGGAEDLSAATEFYDPAANAFMPGPTMNANREALTTTVIVAGPNTGKILLAGGWGEKRGGSTVSVASTELYDPVTNTFASPGATPTMKTPRAYHTATVIPSGPNAGKVLIAGGQDDHDPRQSMEVCSLSSTELYDPTTNQFAHGPQMHWRRTTQSAGVISTGPNAGKILIAGGFGSQFSKATDCRTAPLASTELYDPLTNTFAVGPSMPAAPGVVVAVELPPAPSPRSAGSSSGRPRALRQ